VQFEGQQAEARRQYDARRPERDAYYQTKAWRSLRAACLSRDSTCRAPGCTSPSTIAHHVVPREDGGPDALENLAGLCHVHHEREHARLDRARTQGQPHPASFDTGAV
jgi:5-methylcytosine-specific restriction endonuclease McrA